MTAAAGSVLVFRDDCESPGDHGWSHEDLLPDGQTGVVFARSFESFDGHSGWMMTACDSVSGTMVDGQRSRLRSPPIDIDGASELVVITTGWLDLGTSGEDRAILYVYGTSDSACLWHDGIYGGWYESGGEPIWTRDELVSGYLVDQSWLGLSLLLRNIDPIGTGHGIGFALDRVRVGVPLATGTPDVEALEDRILAIRPNPFNPLTTVDFAVAREGAVALRVYDLSGRLIRTLVEGGFEPGEYESSWDGTDDCGERVASGVYMLRLELQGGESASLKAVLLK